MHTQKRIEFVPIASSLSGISHVNFLDDQNRMKIKERVHV